MNRSGRAGVWRKFLIAIALAALAGSALAAMGGGNTPFWMFASGLRVAL